MDTPRRPCRYLWRARPLPHHETLYFLMRNTNISSNYHIALVCQAIIYKGAPTPLVTTALETWAQGGGRVWEQKVPSQRGIWMLSLLSKPELAARNHYSLTITGGVWVGHSSPSMTIPLHTRVGLEADWQRGLRGPGWSRTSATLPLHHSRLSLQDATVRRKHREICSVPFWDAEWPPETRESGPSRWSRFTHQDQDYTTSVSLPCSRALLRPGNNFQLSNIQKASFLHVQFFVVK